MGAIFRLAFVRTTHQMLQSWRLQRRWQVFGATPQGSSLLWETDLTRPTIVLVGNERSGLTEEEGALCDATIRIPMGGALSSLNVGVAGSVLLYEAVRQRGVG